MGIRNIEAAITDDTSEEVPPCPVHGYKFYLCEVSFKDEDGVCEVLHAHNVTFEKKDI
jgi:hypothetical protein